MQQIERYGVMVLLLMFVTILVVAMWDGEVESPDGAKTPGGPAAVAAATQTRQAPGRTGNRPRQTATQKRETRSVPLGSTTADRSNRASAGNPRSRRAEQQAQPRTELRTVGTPQPASSAPQVLASASVPLGTPRMAGSTGTPAVNPSSDSRRAQSTPSSQSPSINSVATRPAATAQPTARSTHAQAAGWTYEIKSGDTLQGIASRVLGDSKRWTEIQDANDGLDPLRLFVGKRISLPGNAGTPAVSPAARPTAARAVSITSSSGTYVIKKGDVLSRVAQVQLGSASRWREIVELNPGLDPKRLLVGAKLQMPAGPVDDRRQQRSDPSRTAVAVADTTPAASDDSRFRVR